MGCVTRRHRLGFDLVTVTGRSPSNVGSFLVGLKLFYNIMRQIGCYASENPLMDVTSRVWSVQEPDDDDGQAPTMPDVSGVESPRSHKRLTDSFFKLVGRQWVPQIIDDPEFPVSVLRGGRARPDSCQETASYAASICAEGFKSGAAKCNLVPVLLCK